MIIGILLIVLAFLWLLYETNFLRIRLPVGGNPINKSLALPAGRAPLLLDTRHYHFGDFVIEDMPETSGKLQIICVRE
jgi:hypothetical protein